MLGNIPASSARIALTPEGLLVANGERAIALAADGSRELELGLASDGGFVGLDGVGAYYSRAANRTRRGGSALAFEVLRVPVNGGEPVEFWSAPAGRRISALWSAAGGWLATGDYYQADGLPHAVVLFIDSAGAEHVLACAPDSSRILGRPLLSDGILYFVIDAVGQSWRIVAADLSNHD